jgi:hypothetical protein
MSFAPKTKAFLAAIAVMPNVTPASEAAGIHKSAHYAKMKSNPEYAAAFQTNFGQTHTPDRSKANMRAYMWDQMKDWLLHGAIPDDEKLATDLSGPGYHINRSNQFTGIEGRHAEARPGEPG